MLNLFKKKESKITCRFCKVEVDKSASFVLQYKAADGIGSMDVCIECANYMNNIIETWESLHYEKDD